METLPTSQAIGPSPKGVPPAISRPHYLGYEDLQVRTGLSLSTLRRRVREGRIPFFQPGGPGTRIIFPEDVIERLLQPTHTHIAPEQPPEPSAYPTPPRGPKPKWQRGALNRNRQGP